MCIDIDKIAKLSCLQIEGENHEKFMKDMKAVIEMFEGLPAIEEEQISESPVGMKLREDRAEDGKFNEDQLLANAPKVKSGCFCVPKAIEKVTE